MRTRNIYSGILTTFFIIAALLFAGCGSGSGGGSSSATGKITGAAIKGPVSGGMVTAFGINTNGSMGAQIGTATTDEHGNFSMNVENYSGPVMLQLMYGSYMDEATGQVMNMYRKTAMTAVIPDMTAGQKVGNVQITPVTSMAHAWAQSMPGGMTPENITLANGAMGQYFNINDILTTHPMNPLDEGSGAGATQYQQNYGMTIAAMSQEAADLMMPYSSGIVNAMIDDASDGFMDGYMGSAQISMGGMGGMMGGMMEPTAGTSDVATAMMTFIENTTMNRSGLTTTDMQELIDKLNASDGSL